MSLTITSCPARKTYQITRKKRGGSTNSGWLQRLSSLLAKVALCALSLPHSNADAERSFSKLQRIQQDWRGNLGQKTTTSLMSCKMNEDSECFNLQPTTELLKTAKTACSQYKSQHSKPVYNAPNVQIYWQSSYFIMLPQNSSSSIKRECAASYGPVDAVLLCCSLLWNCWCLNIGR